MSSFTHGNYTGFTRAPGQTRIYLKKPGYSRAPPSVHVPSPTRSKRTPSPRRTSKVKFRSPSPTRTTRRRSRSPSPTSPRSKIIKHITTGFKKMSPSRFKNSYARDLGEFVQAVGPFIVGILTVALYTKSLKDE